MRYPGVVLGADEALCPPLPKLVAAQIKESAGCWPRTGAWLTSLIFVKSSYDFHPAAGHAAAIGALKDIGLAGVVESAEIGTLRFGRPWARSSRSTGGFSGGLLRYAFANQLGATVLTADHHEFDALVDRGVCSVRFIR